MPKDEIAVEEIQVLVFHLGGEDFGAEINQIKEIVAMSSITRMPQAAPFIEGVTNLRGQIIPVVSLAKKFGLPSKEKDENTHIVVVEVDEATVGIVADAAPEVLRVSKANIEPSPPLVEAKIDVEYVKGVGKLKERLFILLDLNKVLSPEEIVKMEKTEKA
jgi:purine-binding chemotaxis protein CheW